MVSHYRIHPAYSLEKALFVLAVISGCKYDTPPMLQRNPEGMRVRGIDCPEDMFREKHSSVYNTPSGAMLQT
jgi:hypothetical protein